ncbi:MAG: protein kinase [Sandaracinaceae bacterium]|nr:protein kinase [Sandaracinaceae bacterium]
MGDELLERDTPDEGAINAAAAQRDARAGRPRDRESDPTPAVGGRLRAESGIAPARPPQLGELLDGRYELGALIGRGAMGWVFEGCDHRLSRVVAVKVMRPELASDAALSWRFEQEAIAAGRLNCPHVVTVHDYGSVEGTPYLVMERLYGQSLALRLRGSPDGLPVLEAIAIARDMATALASAEAVGVVHRDLKPGNVFLTESSGAKLLDFGVAKITQGSELSVGPSPTSTGMLIGTPTYMSPEAVSERGEVTAASDVYALGALLFSMIAGEAPFTATEPIVVLHMHLTRDAPRLSAERPDLPIPPALDELVARCLAKEPSARPSAQELVAQLTALSAPTAGIALDPHEPARSCARHFTVLPPERGREDAREDVHELETLALELELPRLETMLFETAFERPTTPDLEAVPREVVAPALEATPHARPAALAPTPATPRRSRTPWIVAGSALALGATLVALIALGASLLGGARPTPHRASAAERVPRSASPGALDGSRATAAAPPPELPAALDTPAPDAPDAPDVAEEPPDPPALVERERRRRRWRRR